MIAAKGAIEKLALAALLALSACAAIPFGVPHGRAGFPIITSGYFALPDGARLPYRLYPAQGPLRAVVLALHGYTDSRDGWKMLAGVLNSRGIAVYAPDQSSFGATPNRGYWPGTDALVDEAREMAVQLRAQYPDTKLFIMGESMGGAIGILLGASADPPPVDGYVLSAPPHTAGDEPRQHLRPGKTPDRPGRPCPGQRQHRRADRIRRGPADHPRPARGQHRRFGPADGRGAVRLRQVQPAGAVPVWRP